MKLIVLLTGAFALSLPLGSALTRRPSPPAAPLPASPVRLSVPSSSVAPARIQDLSAAYLGVPYALDCLGEAAGPDSDPLFTRKAADCQTLVEQVMAEALAPHVGGLDEAIRITRYGGPPLLERRYHFCAPDWLTAPWPVRDITSRVAAGKTVAVTRKIDLARLLSGRGGDPSLAPYRDRRVTYAAIPRSRAAGVIPKIPDGSIILFVSSSPLVVAGHMGFFFRRGGGTLRHASQTKGKVIDQTLSSYLSKMPSHFTGIMVLQPDVSGLARQPYPAARSRT